MTGLLHIVLARKPLEGTVAENCLQWGCGALWIDGTRVATDWNTDSTRRGWQGRNLSHGGGSVRFVDHEKELSQPNNLGRWPANLILGGEEVVEGFPTARSAGNYPSTYVTQDNNAVYGKGVGNVQGQLYSDSGSASRFFFNFSEQEADE